MHTQFSILALDRFEGDTACLLNNDEGPVELPRRLLPHEAKEGDVFSVAISLDQEATDRLKTDTKEIQDDLAKRDPGGDIEL